MRETLSLLKWHCWNRDLSHWIFLCKTWDWEFIFLDTWEDITYIIYKLFGFNRYLKWSNEAQRNIIEVERIKDKTK